MPQTRALQLTGVRHADGSMMNWWQVAVAQTGQRHHQMPTEWHIPHRHISNTKSNLHSVSKKSYLFIFAINLRHRKFVTADVTAVSVNNEHGTKWHKQDFDKTFIWNQYEERHTILNTENIKIRGWTTKLEAIKMQYVCISAMSAEYLQKIWIFSFPR